MCQCQSRVIDARDITHAGRQLTVTIFEDPDPHPDEADCYSADDVAAWRRDDWRYVGVVITEGGEHIDALWAVHYGHGDGWCVGTDEIISEHPVPDMLTALVTAGA